MNCQDMYIRLTHPITKKSIVNYHRVWDKEKFLASQIEAYDAMENEDERRLVTVASKEEYLQYRKGN